MSTLGRLTRNTRRFQEIAATLVKYGLADWLGESLPELARRHLESAEGERLTELSREQRIRLALTDLGTTFIKIGQVLSTRSDLVGPELARELSKLQAETRPDPPEVVRETIENELGVSIEEAFVELDLRPLASASIGQVHAARLVDGLADGREVVVKVQHRGIEEVVANDLDILGRLAELAERHSRELRLYRPQALVAQFRRELLRELDFSREARNQERFRTQFSGSRWVSIPRPYPELSTRRVLVMDRIEGTSLRDIDALKRRGIDLEQLARRGANIYLEMIFEHGFYHADPHPGNIFVLKSGKLCLLDSGMVGQLDEGLRSDVEELLLSALRRDSERMADVVCRLGSPPAELDREQLERELGDFVEDYGEEAVESWDFGEVLGDLTRIVRRHRIHLPTDAALLLRMLVVLEGTARQLSPSFSLGELLRPYAGSWVGRKFSPQRLLRRLERSYRDWGRLLDTVPRELTEVLKRVRSGTFDVHLQHRGLDATVNRLIYGILTAALILASSQLWSSQIPPLIGSVSLLAIGAGLLAAFLGLRLLLAVERSGSLGRRRKD